MKTLFTNSRPVMLMGVLWGMGCNSSPSPQPGPFADDVAFMRQHTPILVLEDGKTAVAVAPAYPGRVITSTYNTESRPGFASDGLNIKIPKDLEIVGYETDNRITNVGENTWEPETGLPSIWILGMYNPSPETTVVIPFREGDEKELGPKVTDSYFGKVPPEYLRVEDRRLFFKGDGTLRSKIGISPQRALGMAGSYDAAGRVLTVVTYNVQRAPHGFVNSMWEHQKEPYAGDVINAYNDGPPEPGAPPLGPFYELETSSPAAALKPGETMRHIQRTFHIHGPERSLNPLAEQLLGADLKTINSAF